MVGGIKKYNPGFLSDDEIVALFCVRNAEFESLLETLHANDGNSNVHSLVIGPRGSGKTHLLLRVAAEIRRDASLSEFYPIVFAEESYEVGTVGEFWLECLDHLAEQAPECERANLRLSYNDLRTTGDDRDLAGRCLGTILDFAGRHGKRVVLLVENLNMLFADMDNPDAGWRLRHTLQTEPRIVLLGSATSRFDEIDHPDHALYDLFRVTTLRPLDTQECLALWKTVTEQPATALAVRPLEILTGGNPRLLTIVALFGAGRSFRGADGQPAGPSGRPHGLLQEPPGIVASTGASGLSLGGQVVETRDSQGGCRPVSSRYQQVQRSAGAINGTWRCSRRRGDASAQAVLPDRAALQHLLPVA